MNTIEESAPARRRRRHSAEFKAKAVQDCMHPGVSIAAVALHHRVNANLLRRWVVEHQALDAAGEARALMTVLTFAASLVGCNGSSRFPPLAIAVARSFERRLCIEQRTFTGIVVT